MRVLFPSHTHTHTHTHTHMHTHTLTHTHTDRHSHTHAHTSTHTLCVCISVSMYTLMLCLFGTDETCDRWWRQTPWSPQHTHKGNDSQDTSTLRCFVWVDGCVYACVCACACACAWPYWSRAAAQL